MVVAYLPRSSVQSLRLVNRESERKVSAELFKTVVVPFKPEIYGISDDLSGETWPFGYHSGQHDSPQDSSAIMLQDKGMRVFQGFGRYIDRFAMSFELDYNILAEPPVKCDQEAVTTFWGTYRWPFNNYSRYMQLEGLEQVADQTRTMTKALEYINNAKELGLSIDGGLGWLDGPDINQRVVLEHRKLKVFGKSRFVVDKRRNAFKSKQSNVSISIPTRNLRSLDRMNGRELENEIGNRTMAEQMVPEADYNADLSRSVRIWRDSEGQGVALDSDSVASSSSPDTASTSQDFDDVLQDDVETWPGSTINQATVSRDDVKSLPLRPNELSNAQREVLLETEWAQRAFMQSYCIAIIDNPSTFRTITKLTLARLPSRHLSILNRADFWASLMQLSNVSLAIIPEWRDITKSSSGLVEDAQVPPSQSILAVYEILNDQIGPRESIKTLHFEWICGGEYANGMFARNRNILAAPFVSDAMDMVSRVHHAIDILSLPHIEKLSLKNCWVSPHILLHMTKLLRSQALQSLVLHSVSLSAPGSRDVPGPANPRAQNAAQHAFLLNGHVGGVFPGLLNGQHAPVLQAEFQPQALQGAAVPTAIQAALLNLQQLATQPVEWNHPAIIQPFWQPHHSSWAYFIDRITPSRTLGDMRRASDSRQQLSSTMPTRLKSIVFESCGYIRLPLDLDHSFIDPDHPIHYENQSNSTRRNLLEAVMMKSRDHTLGTIVNHMNERESETLQSVWGLQLGWGKAGKKMAARAAADGIRAPGQGRFRGVVVQ